MGVVVVVVVVRYHILVACGDLNCSVYRRWHPRGKFGGIPFHQ